MRGGSHVTDSHDDTIWSEKLKAVRIQVIIYLYELKTNRIKLGTGLRHDSQKSIPTYYLLTIFFRRNYCVAIDRNLLESI